ncbi:hypothetical protein K474DRAFT_1655962 [Panus rudis PR-1116 ss-1]|nr:hypothetical protein K474DRAFT_1655962 [Panus rudis PR-1116 ss-1]
MPLPSSFASSLQGSMPAEMEYNREAMVLRVVEHIAEAFRHVWLVCYPLGNIEGDQLCLAPVTPPGISNTTTDEHLYYASRHGKNGKVVVIVIEGKKNGVLDAYEHAIDNLIGRSFVWPIAGKGGYSAAMRIVVQVGILMYHNLVDQRMGQR